MATKHNCVCGCEIQFNLGVILSTVWGKQSNHNDDNKKIVLF